MLVAVVAVDLLVQNSAVDYSPAQGLVVLEPYSLLAIIKVVERLHCFSFQCTRPLLGTHFHCFKVVALLPHLG